MRSSTVFGIACGVAIGAVISASMQRPASAQAAVQDAEAKGQVAGSATVSGQETKVGSVQGVASGVKVVAGKGQAQVAVSARDATKALFVVRLTRVSSPQPNLMMGHERFMAQSAHDGRVLMYGECDDRSIVYVGQFKDRSEADAFVGSDPAVASGSLTLQSLMQWTLTHDTYGPQRLITVPRPGKRW